MGHYRADSTLAVRAYELLSRTNPSQALPRPDILQDIEFSEGISLLADRFREQVTLHDRNERIIIASVWIPAHQLPGYSPGTHSDILRDINAIVKSDLTRKHCIPASYETGIYTYEGTLVDGSSPEAACLIAVKVRSTGFDPNIHKLLLETVVKRCTRRRDRAGFIHPAINHATSGGSIELTADGYDLFAEEATQVAQQKDPSITIRYDHGNRVFQGVSI